jgi:hypothetical protein
MTLACGTVYEPDSHDSMEETGNADAFGSEMEELRATNRARSERGYEISPVPLDTQGLSRKQKLRVGIGSYIVNGASECNGCHGGAGYLSGGAPFPLDAHGHVVYARNLTPDPETGLDLTEAQFIESMRTGKDFHMPMGMGMGMHGEMGMEPSKMLVVMPWQIFRWMSDEDLSSIYAYLRAVPPVMNEVPHDHKDDLPLPESVPFPGFYNDGQVDRRLAQAHESFGALRGLSIAPHKLPRHVERQWLTQLRKLQSYGLGAYIANSMGQCNDCHTKPPRTENSQKINLPAFLTGGTVFAVPPPLQGPLGHVRATSENLTGAMHGHFSEPDDSYEHFRDLIKSQGQGAPAGSRILGFPMNFVAANLANLLEGDLRALYDYLKQVPKVTGEDDQPRQGKARYCAADTDCRTGETCAEATHECVGSACTADSDCGTCQTCSAGACAAPAADSACVATAQ